MTIDDLVRAAPLLAAMADYEYQEVIEIVRWFAAGRRRGGDPLAQQRRQRDEDLRALRPANWGE